MIGEEKESLLRQTSGSLDVSIDPKLVSLGDSSISLSIYNVLKECHADDCRFISCDDPGPKCSAEIHFGENDGLVRIDYIARSENRTVGVEWFSDDGVDSQTVEEHARLIVAEAHYEDYHPGH